MILPAIAREIADKINATRKKSLDAIYTKAWKKHEKYIEESIEEFANLGKYSCMSDNLCDTDYLDEIEYSPTKLEEFLKGKIKTVFGDALGYTIIDDHSNYLTISWESEDLAG